MHKQANDTPTASVSNTTLLPLSWTLVITALFVIGLSPFMPLFDLDEGAFTEATREMLVSGNWVSTYLNGQPRHDKPILIYWLQASSTLLFGWHEFTLRLPSLISAFAWLWVVYRFCKEFINEQTAIISVFIMATAWLALPIYKAAIADSLLNWLLCLTFFDMYRYIKKPNTLLLMRIGAVMGLGFLTKGPVSIVLPIGSYFIAMAYCQKLPLLFKACFHPAAIFTFIIIILPWHIAVYLDQGWGFFQGFYLGHNIGRFTNTMEQHGGSVFYYILLLPLLVLPFSKQLFALFASMWQQLKPANASFLHCVCSAWFLLTLLVFSFSQTQLPHYLLYGLTPIYILLAHRLQNNHSTVNNVDLLIASIGLILLLFIPLAIPLALPNIKHAYEYALTLYIHKLYLAHFIYIAIAIIGISLFVTYTLKKPLQKLFLLSAATGAATNFVLMPLIAQGQQGPVKEAAAIATQTLQNTQSKQTKLVSYQTNMPSFSVYTQQIVTKDLPTPGNIVFTRAHAVNKLQNLNPDITLTELYNKGGILLYHYGQYD